MPNLAQATTPAPLTEGQHLFLSAVRETLTSRGASAALAAAVEAETARLRDLMDGTHPVSPESAALAGRLLAAHSMEGCRQILESARP